MSMACVLLHEVGGSRLRKCEPLPVAWRVGTCKPCGERVAVSLNHGEMPMATQTQWDSIPDVEEQTKLENGPIKIRWSGRDRARVRRALVASLEDDHIEHAVAVPVMMRQKTQIVIKTKEELEAFRSELAYTAKWRVERRIEREIEKQLNGDGDEVERERSDSYKRRQEETDMSVVMDEIIIPHAKKWATEVWPGGTVDVDDISWFWNYHLTSCAGKAYWWGSEPNKRYDVSSPAIGLAPGYYYQHGLDEMLAVVRHELIHVWQKEHKMGKSDGGHGPDFKQWIDDMDTHRHCKLWSK